jgi:hypothetical protein
VRVALTLTLVAVLAGAAAVLSAERPRLAGTNNVFDLFGNVALAPGQEACAMAELVPGRTAAVRVHAQPSEPTGGRLAVRLVQDGRELASGSRPGGWSDGQIDVPVRPEIAQTRDDVDDCFTNDGSASITLWGYGAVAGRPQRAVVEGEPLTERPRLSYLRPGSESGWDLLGAVMNRMGIGRGAWMEGWAFYGWLAALVGTLAVVVTAALRGVRS